MSLGTISSSTPDGSAEQEPRRPWRVPLWPFFVFVLFAPIAGDFAPLFAVLERHEKLSALCKAGQPSLPLITEAGRHGVPVNRHPNSNDPTLTHVTLIFKVRHPRSSIWLYRAVERLSGRVPVAVPLDSEKHIVFDENSSGTITKVYD